MSEFEFAFLGGAARAVVFAVFALAGVGKLLGCTGGARSLCRKAGVDLAAASLVCLPWPAPSLLAGLLALAVGAGGWLAERIRHNPTCRCFGLLNRALHGQRNLLRLALAIGGTVLAATASSSGAAAGWAGAAVTLALALVAAVYALGAAMREPARPGRKVAFTRHSDAAFAAQEQAGQWADGRSASFAELRRGDAPLALLFSMRGCPECDALKTELQPFSARLPFALHVLEKGETGAGLTDRDGVLARRLGIVGFPTLVVLDPRTLRVEGPFAIGAAEIRQQVMRLVLRKCSAPVHLAEVVAP
jgi:hypothetical protein